MKCLVSSILCFFATVSFAQYPSLGSAEVIPSNPTTNDEVFLATYVTTAYQGSYLGSAVSVSNNIIFVESCYFEGVSASPSTYYDTISLGFLNSGIYSLEYTIFGSTSTSSCDYLNDVQYDITFSVEQYTALSEIPVNQISIYPNPATSGTLHIISSNKMETIKLFDTRGQLHYMCSETPTDDHVIKTTGLTNGLYYLELSFADEGRIRKPITIQ